MRRSGGSHTEETVFHRPAVRGFVFLNNTKDEHDGTESDQADDFQVVQFIRRQAVGQQVAILHRIPSLRALRVLY